MNYFLIDESGVVVNTIVWDGDEENNPYNPGNGHILIKSDKAGVGDVYDRKTKKFTKPLPKESE